MLMLMLMLILMLILILILTEDLLALADVGREAVLVPQPALGEEREHKAPDCQHSLLVWNQTSGRVELTYPAVTQVIGMNTF